MAGDEDGAAAAVAASPPTPPRHGDGDGSAAARAPVLGAVARPRTAAVDRAAGLTDERKKMFEPPEMIASKIKGWLEE